MAPGGVIYTITDVKEVGCLPTGCWADCGAVRWVAKPCCGCQVGVWMREKLAAHPCFEPLSEEELAADPAVALLNKATEEGQKVARNEGQVCSCCGVQACWPCLGLTGSGWCRRGRQSSEESA